VKEVPLRSDSIDHQPQ